MITSIRNAALSIAAASMVASPVAANVGDSMDRFMDDMGAAANVTGPSAFEGQSAGYYSLGNVWTRFPQKTTNIANLQLPRARAGCGGIDIFAGSFSFINASEMVALLKAVANNAVGFAFSLAIDTVCPECSKIMQEFSQKAQLMNNLSINSCEMAQGLVGGVWPKGDLADKAICEAIGNSEGIFTDYAAAKHGCGTRGQRASTNESAGADYADVNPGVPRNYTWHVLKQGAFFNPGGTFDRDLAEYAMTLIGTVIYVPPRDDEPGKFVPFAGDASSTLVTALLDGTQGQSVRVFQCDEPDQCLNPTFQQMSLTSAKAIRPRVAQLIGSMVEAIRSDTAIGDEEKELLQVASVPLYKILTVQAAYGRGMATDDRDTLAEIASIDLLYAILERITSEAGRSMASFIAADEAKLAIWRSQVAEVRSSLAQRQATGQARVSAIMQIIEKTAMIENMLAASMSPSMAAALDWSRGMQSRSIVPYQYLTGISRSASDIFRQVLTINAMNQAMHGFAGASGTGSIDVFAQTRADIQTERTYSSIAHNAMKWVPILNVVLTVVFYALFPVLFPLFLMPRTGPIALRGYVTGFFYLAAWGPLFVILHMILMFKGAGDVAAAGGSTGLSLATFAGMSDVNSDIGILAGYLVASIPFLAGGVARGALAISGQATSYLNPSQNAAEEASREASTGNVSLGNSNIDNSTVFSRQFAQGNLAPNIAYGATQTRGFSDSGTQTTSFPDGEFAAVPNSSYPFTPTLGQDFTGRLGTMASQSRTQSETYANLAQQSTSSALTRFSEIRNAYSQGQSSDTVSGVGTNDSIGTAFSEVDNASRTLQQQYGLSRRASDDITISWFLNGDASLGLKGERGPGTAQLGVRGGRNQSWTDSDIGIASEDRGRIMGTLRQLSDSRNWSNTREGFLRETSSSSVSQVSTSSSGLSRSLTEAEGYTREARRAEEMASRLENQASWYEANSAAGTLNLSQAYREWGMAEIEANRDYYGPVRFDDIEFQMSARGQQLQSRFVESYADRLQDDIEADLSLPDFAPVSRPGIGSAGQVRARGTVGSTGGPSMPDAPDRSGISDEVERVRRQGRGRIGTVRGYLDGQTEGATGASEEAADAIKEWRRP